MIRAHRATLAPRARTPRRLRTEAGRTTSGRRDGGFTLIELLLVVTIIGILASIALPPISKARASSLEAATIGSLRAMNTAQASFAVSCAGGSYAPTVASLNTPPTGSTTAFIGPGIGTDSVNRQGYGIRFTAGPKVPTAPKTCNGLAKGAAVQSYFIEASPLATGNGLPTRYFGTGSGGTIYQSTKRVAAYYSPASPAAPAKPIQ